MALFLTFARRLQRTQPQLFLPLILQLHPITRPIHHLSQSFHQTLLVPSQPFPHNPHLSTFQPFPTQTLYEPIDITEHRHETHEPHQPGVLKFLELLKQAMNFPSEGEAIAFLDESGIEPNQDLVCSAIWALRDEWRVAFLVFKWGERWGCNGEKAWGLMIWVLGNHKKFKTAWCLIRDLRRSSEGARRAMLVMIDRYAAANYPCKAIRTFHIMEKFRMTPDLKAFYTLMSALCKYGNVEEAEEFMLQNKKLFPLEIEGFNIILNGWCNISVDVFEAKRVWREMSKCCITPNAASYTHMISCFSKVGNLFDSLRLYDGMQKRGWVPGIEVYNSLVYILTRENCLKEALKILDRMKETGLQLDSATYNSMIRPLCEANKLEEARSLLATMIGENLSPTIETYHSFLEGASFEGTLEILNRMMKADFGPNRDTFLLILNKFIELEQPENSLKIWVEMKQYEVVPDSTHYTVLVQGLARCGWLIKARELYAEMRSNGFLEDPKLKKLLKEPVRDNSRQIEGQVRVVRQINRDTQVHHRKGSAFGSKKTWKPIKKEDFS